MTAPGVPAPPVPFNPEVITLPIGHPMYRVHSNNRGSAEFNPGKGAPTRFAFFGTPSVPILYGADTEAAAICESILHEVPMTGGSVGPTGYKTKVAGRIITNREVRLASFLGTGLWRLNVEAEQLTRTTAAHYGQTVLWAQAAHEAGFDGVAYMSKRCNSDRAYALFGDRFDPSDFAVDPSYGRIFNSASDLAWLSDFCAPFSVDVIIL